MRAETIRPASLSMVAAAMVTKAIASATARTDAAKAVTGAAATTTSYGIATREFAASAVPANAAAAVAADRQIGAVIDAWRELMDVDQRIEEKDAADPGETGGEFGRWRQGNRL